MLVMAHQTFQLNVKIFAQLYQVKIQGAVDTTIFKHSVVWPGWKKHRERQRNAETQARSRKRHSQIIFTLISTPK